MSDRRETTLHPDITNPDTLVDRLRGIYRIPIRDGLGPVGAGDEPDNPAEYVRSFPTPPIQQAAADEIERLRRIEEAAEFLVQNDMAGIVEDSAWTRLREALGIEVSPI